MSSDPQRQIFVGESQIEADIISSLVTQRESGVWDALLLANDLQGKTFLANISPGSVITVNHRYGTGAWKTVFAGSTAGLAPQLDMGGELCAVQAYGKGRALKNMRVARTYGVQGEYNALLTPRQILTGTGGVIPDFVHKVLGGASSGYTLDTNYIFGYLDDLEIPYLPAVYENAFDLLRDLINLAGAMRFPDDPGLHWIVTPAGELCLAPVGDHNVKGASADYTIETKWPTWASEDPVIVGEDMIVLAFNKREREASHITVCGKFRRPPLEIWTNGAASLWEPKIVGVPPSTVTDDSTVFIVGDDSIKMHNTVDTPGWNFFRLKEALGVDVSKLWSLKGPPKVVGKIWRGAGIADGPHLCLFKDWDNYFRKELPIDESKWLDLDVEIGHPNYAADGWIKGGTLTWADIQYLGFAWENAGGQDADLRVDDLRIIGNVIRVAWDSSLSPVKMRFIRDSLSETDSLDAANDNNALGIAAKFELLKSRHELFSGKIQIPLDPDIMPGQLIKVRNPRNSNWPVDSGENYLTMRILEAQHNWILAPGARTILTLADDLTSSVSQGPVDQLNALLKAVNPDYQTRDFATLKSSGVELDLDPLVKDYSP